MKNRKSWETQYEPVTKFANLLLPSMICFTDETKPNYAEVEYLFNVAISGSGEDLCERLELAVLGDVRLDQQLNHLTHRIQHLSTIRGANYYLTDL